MMTSDYGPANLMTIWESIGVNEIFPNIQSISGAPCATIRGRKVWKPPMLSGLNSIDQLPLKTIFGSISERALQREGK